MNANALYRTPSGRRFSLFNLNLIQRNFCTMINRLFGKFSSFTKVCAASIYVLPGSVFAEPSSALMVETGIGALARTVTGLLMVLGLIFGCAWIARRLGIRPTLRRTGVIKLIDGMALTQREKVVVVEVRGTWLVLGLAQGSVRVLHQCPAVPERGD